MAKRLTDLGAVPVGGPSERLAVFQRVEQEKWGKVIQVAKIKPDQGLVESQDSSVNPAHVCPGRPQRPQGRGPGLGV